jgi:hypothetical protein
MREREDAMLQRYGAKPSSLQEKEESTFFPNNGESEAETLALEGNSCEHQEWL